MKLARQAGVLSSKRGSQTPLERKGRRRSGRTWVEEITNPPVEGVQRWYHIEFDLGELLPPGSSAYLPIVVRHPELGEGR